MAIIPEHAPHLPAGEIPGSITTIPRPDDISPSLAEAAAESTKIAVRSASVGGFSLGKALLIGTPLLGAVAGGIMAFSADRGPSSTPVDNAPVSDTFKPPEEKQPSVGIAIPIQSPDNPSVSPSSGTGLDEPDGPKSPEAVNQAKCVFIQDPTLCLLGQPRTREGKEDRILAIEYNDIPNTPINTKPGYFSVVKDSSTSNIIGVSVRFSDGVSLNVDANDLVIDNKFSREVAENEVIARVGKSGSISFSPGIPIDKLDQISTLTQSFFENNFPPEVTKKPKKILPAATGSPSYGITDRYGG